MKKFLLVYLVSSVGLFPLLAQKKHLNVASNSFIEEGVVIIKLKSNTSFGTASALVSGVSNHFGQLSFNIEEVKPVFDDSPSSRSARSVSKSGIDFSLYRKITFDQDLNPQAVASELNKLEQVAYAEPIYLQRIFEEPNDPELSSQTYLRGIKAVDAWEVTKGSSDIVVAIIDSGVDYQHPDLKNKIFLNEGEIANNGIDDDNDGYVDNYLGWDFAGDDFENIVQDNDPLAKQDNVDHGTAVAGCAAAETDNGIGVAGMGYNAMYMALKCSAENDQRDSGSALLLNTNDAVIYAADHGADIINMSYGSGFFSQFTQDVMTYAAVEKDVVLVASAGNGGVEEFNYPAAYEHVLSVANVTDGGEKANSSTFGTWVDMSAPGTNVRTTGIKSTYINISGTSFSSPITAGAAALIRSQFPEYNQFQVRQILKQTSQSVEGVNVTAVRGLVGNGRLNMFDALTKSVPAIDLFSPSFLTAEGEIPNRGETGILSFNLLNQLAASSASTVIEITEESGLAFEGDSTVQVGILATDEVKTIEGIQLVIPDDVTFNKLLTFNIKIEDVETGFLETYVFSAVANPLVTEDATLPYLITNGGDFEDENSGFKSGQVAGGLDVWERGVPSNELTNVNSGTQVWKTDLDADLPKETYSCVLQTPGFDFSDDTKAYQLSFYKSMESEYCNAPYIVQLQYSLDGINWERLGTEDDPRGTNWYNKSPTSLCPIDQSIILDQHGWLGNYSNEFTAYNISELAGNDAVSFRFLLNVSGSFSGDINDDGFMMDDFQIEIQETSADFYAKRKVNYIGREIEFEYLSNGATSFNWNFGDNSVSDERNPIHIYGETGVYDVSLAIVSPDGPKEKLLEGYVNILPNLNVPFGLEDGGNFEVNTQEFGAENISGSGFFLGNSSVEGKAGTSSGDLAWVIDPDAAQYLDESEAYLYSPVFDFSLIGNYEISFKANYSFEAEWEGFIVEYSTNRGDSWIKLNNVIEEDWYDMISVANDVAVFGSEQPIFSGSTNNEFILKKTDVSFLGGKSGVSFRFVFKSDGNTVDAGMAIDDFEMAGPSPGTITASMKSLLDSGTVNCTGQSVSFTANVSGSVESAEWDFGAGANPTQASGVGPHLVSFPAAGVNEVSLTVTDADGNVILRDTTIVTDASHTPEITAVSNGNGTVTLTASTGESHQWLLNGEPIDGATEQTYLADEDGEFSVEVLIGACLGVSTFEQVTVTGINSIFANLKVYPNPVTSELSITNVSFSSSLTIKLYEISGKEVLNTEYEQVVEELALDLGGVESGIYILEVNVDDLHTFKQKLIKR